jgi:hypothetical protein
LIQLLIYLEDHTHLKQILLYLNQDILK